MNFSLSSLFFCYRGAILIIYFLIVCLFCYQYTVSFFWWGSPVIILGLAIRLASSFYITDTNVTELSSPKLATEGLYAWIRNPLYLANILVGIGFLICVSKEDLWFLILMSFILCLHHLIVIKIEENFLIQKWGPSYFKYQQKVTNRLFNFKKARIRWHFQVSFKKAFQYQFYNLLKTTVLFFTLVFLA